MNRTQALTITRLCKSAFPAMRIDEFTPEVWGEALEPYHFETMRQAITLCATRRKFVSLSELVTAGKQIRSAVADTVSAELRRENVDWWSDEYTQDPDPTIERERRNEQRRLFDQLVNDRITGRVYLFDKVSLEAPDQQDGYYRSPSPTVLPRRPNVREIGAA